MINTTLLGIHIYGVFHYLVITSDYDKICNETFRIF